MRIRFIPQLITILVAGLSFGAWTRGGPNAITSTSTISSVNPNNGGPAGGTTVTIAGTGFVTVSAINFGATPATGYSCTSTSCTAIAPAGTGAQSVTVVNSGGTSNGVTFTYAAVVETFTAGTTDSNSIIMGGTETRQLVAHRVANGNKLQQGGASCSSSSPSWDGVGCQVIFLGAGYWKETNCSTTSLGANQGPQVDILTSSRGSWTNDLNINDSGCVQDAFTVINALVNPTFSYDAGGNAITTTLVIASGDAVDIHTRNDSTGSWQLLTLSGTDTTRTMSHHIDTSQTANGCVDLNCRDYLLLGRDRTGVSAATLTVPTTFATPGPESISVDGTGGNLCGAQTLIACTNLNSQWTGLNFTGSGCSPQTVQGCLGELRSLSVTDCKVTSGGNANGYAAFVTWGFQIWRRHDAGSGSYWVLWNEAPNSVVTFNSGQNGFRGMTCIPDPSHIYSASGFALLAQAQVQGASIAFDPNTQMTLSPPSGYGGTTEVNLKTCLKNFWPKTTGALLNAYNGSEMFQYNNSIIMSEGNAVNTPASRPQYSNTFEAVGGFWARPVGGPGSGPCNGYTVYPTSPGVTGSPDATLATIKTNSCGAASGTCTNTYNGNANPTVTTAHFCQTDANGYCAIMGSARSVICSPFPEDGAASGNGFCGQVLFYGGRDMQNGGSGHNTAWAIRLPVDNNVSIP